MKLKTYLTVGLFTLGAPLAAQAALDFDTEGLGGAGDTVTLDAFDWAQNSFLAEGGTDAILARSLIGNGNDCGTACDFTVYTHGTLNAATLDGASVWSPQFSGDDPVEVTFTLSFTETVTSVDNLVGLPRTSEFAVVTNPVTEIGDAVFQMYFDTNVNADAVSGSGYNDGILILYGDLILDSTGSFTTTDNGDLDPFIDLDQSGNGNDYDGQFTSAGSGDQATIDIGGLTQDPNFFLSSLAAFGFDFSNLSQEVPFTTVSPSDCFTTSNNGAGNVGSAFGLNGCNTAHIDGTFEQNELGAADLVPRTGTINGSPQFGIFAGTACTSLTPNGLVNACPDFVAQTDANSAVQVDIPEPGTLAITGLGLLLLGARRRGNKV